MTGRICEINLVSTQSMGNEKEVTRESYTGRFLDRNEKKYLSYERSTEDGTVECLLMIGPGRMTMTQRGSLTSKLEFIPGKTTDNKYLTPMGAMNIPVYTKGLSIYDKKNTIEIMLDYDIAAPDSLHTTIEIRVLLGRGLK